MTVSIHQRAEDGLGKRIVKRNKQEYKTPWFNELQIRSIFKITKEKNGEVLEKST